MSAAHYKLTNLITIVDRNGLMIDGPTEEVMAIEPLKEKFGAFGFHTVEVDGHDYNALSDALDKAISNAGEPGVRDPEAKPTAIIAKTVKGKGVDYMENEMKWHYGSVDSELAAKAKASIEKMYA
jgi:transketolase